MSFVRMQKFWQLGIINILRAWGVQMILCDIRPYDFPSTFKAFHSFFKTTKCHFQDFFQSDYMSGDTVLAVVASILTWESISDRRRSWPSPSLGAGARHQESHKKTDGDAEGRHLLGACQTGSHQKQLPTAGRQGTSVHGHGGGWVLRLSQRLCLPVLELEESQHEGIFLKVISLRSH